jgi:hypothetical protein
MPLGAARIALFRRAAVLVGTAGWDRTVRIGRVVTEGLSGAEGERVLMDRLAAELSARIAAGPEAWLGLFAPVSLRNPTSPR